MPSASASTIGGTAMTRSKSLSALEAPFLDSITHRVTSKTLASSVSTQYIRDEEMRVALAEQQRVEAAHKRYIDMRPENRATAQRGGQGHGHGGNGKGGLQSGAQPQHDGDSKEGEDQPQQQQRMSFIESEEKTKSFAEVIKLRTRMIALNDKLCHDEGKLRPKKKRLRLCPP